MAKAKTSKKQKISSLDTLKKHKTDTKLLLNKKLIVEVLIESLLKNDIQTFRDVLISHIRTMSKTSLAKKTGLGRRTLYDLIENENFDPRLSTLGSLLSKLAA